MGKRLEPLNTWVIRADIDSRARTNKTPLFEELTGLPSGPTGTPLGSLRHVKLSGEQWGLLTPITLNIPRCAKVFAGPFYHSGGNERNPEERSIQVIATGFADNPMYASYLSLLRKEDIRQGEASLVIIPWLSSEESSWLYNRIIKYKGYSKPNYWQIWDELEVLTPTRGNYPIRSAEVKELEKKLR